MTLVMNYGGGRQTVGICVLVAHGELPRPDVIVMADTSRENPSTWEYLERHMVPYLAKHNLAVEIAPHSLATVDIYGKNGGLLLPAFTSTGKLRTYCSNEWKRRVVDRYLRGKGIRSGRSWLGYGFEEKRRWEGKHGVSDGKWETWCPLVELGLTTSLILDLIAKEGLPEPHHSSCWMCPHKKNDEWRHLRDNYPEYWNKAIALDQEIREEDEENGVYLHASRKPLSEADIDGGVGDTSPGCSSGTCFF